MKRDELRDELLRGMESAHVSADLSRRTILAAQGEEKTYMKKKISFAVVFALITVTLCAAAIAAANRWGMLDFVDRYSSEHYIPADAQDYVETDVAVLENEWVTVHIRELYYDGRISRMTADVMPKQANTLIVGEDVFLEDPFVNLTNNYVMDGDNDMRSVWQVIQDEGYQQVYTATVYLKGVTGAMEDMVMGSGDYILGEDGMLTIYSQEEYATDMPQREAVISVLVMPFDQPLTMDSRGNYEKAEVLEMPVVLKASVNPTSQPVKEGEIANVFVSEAPVEYESVGVRVNRVRIEVKPQEIYATVEYIVTDREKYDATDGGLWFEFIDPQKPGEGWQQRLAEGLSGGGSVGPTDGDDPATAVKFRQAQTLGKNELHDVYTLRAYNCWEKNRYETQEIAMRPATQEDME